MPLHFLSNGAEKPFELTKDAVRLKPQYHPYRRDDRFRELVTERPRFAEARYWNNRESKR